MKYSLDELWTLYREFCDRTQVGNENIVGGFLSFLKLKENENKEKEA